MTAGPDTDPNSTVMGEQMPEETPDTGEQPAEEPVKPDEAKPEPEPKPDTDDEKDWAVEAKKWQAQARKHEKEWKKFSKELDEARKAQMSEQEKAVAEAETRGRQAAAADVGKRLAAAEIKAALTGVVADPVTIVDDLNLTKYVNDDGEVDLDAIAELKTRFEAMSPSRPARDPDFGARPPTTPAPNSDAAMDNWLRTASRR